MTQKTVPLLKSAIEQARQRRAPDSHDLWDIGDVGEFSSAIRLYGYQENAVNSAVDVLRLYFGDKPGAAAAAHREGLYGALVEAAEIEADKRGGAVARPDAISYRPSTKDSHGVGNRSAFEILSEGLPGEGAGQPIPFKQTINRACFWMATGSGKTLVMIKVIDCLIRLMDAGAIPRREIMLLIPGERHRKRYASDVAEFNRRARKPIELIDLSKFGRGQMPMGCPVFCYPAHLVADVVGKRGKSGDVKTLDWRRFDLPDSGWYILQDEAHHGDADESRLRAPKAMLARNGFLFNFSATFVDKQDIITTAYDFALNHFIHRGYGKNIHLIDREFGNSGERFSILKSLIALAFVKRNVRRLRKEIGDENAYHEPLMLTVAHSVAKMDSHLRAFFEALVALADGISVGGITNQEFTRARDELKDDLGRSGPLFGGVGKLFLGDLAHLDIAELRRAVFGDQNPSEWEVITANRGGKEDKEMAIKLIGADRPFALLVIGDNREWIDAARASGISVSERTADSSFFAALETDPAISILLGSRMFFESWDTVRPNVINFINLGMSSQSRKFVAQTVGRGVRVRPLRHAALTAPRSDDGHAISVRRRIGHIENGTLPQKWQEFQQAQNQNNIAAESLFLFATQPDTIQTILKQAALSDEEDFAAVGDCFDPIGNDAAMELLVPQYVRQRPKNPHEFSDPPGFGAHVAPVLREMGGSQAMGNSMLAVIYGQQAEAIKDARVRIAASCETRGDNAGNIPRFDACVNDMFRRIKISRSGHKADGVRKLLKAGGERDIVHFTDFRIARSLEKDFRKSVDGIKQIGPRSGDKRKEAMRQIARMEADGDISTDEAQIRRAGLQSREVGGALNIDIFAEHYYMPVVRARDNTEAARERARRVINHAIVVKSELDFLENLMDSTGEAQKAAKKWDDWMFCRLKEQVDKVYIPYLGDRKFYPDFIFWMWRAADKQYHIVFVDPKGTAHSGYLDRVEGYSDLFEVDTVPCRFGWGSGWTVRVLLWLYNPSTAPGKEYRRFWAKNAAPVFDDRATSGQLSGVPTRA